MSRYINGLNEAQFKDVLKWLRALGVAVIGGSVFLVMGSHISTKPINLLDKTVVLSHFDAVLDNCQWINDDKQIEENKGHKVWYLSKKQSREFKFRVR
ncbi:MAG: hypothetical protein LBM72_01495 [Mycoplasmataceae bacterium]|nr:hypothetical protein [Mycoplasmataceae bacterium]